MMDAKTFLLQTYPFVFVDQFKKINENTLHGEVCFDKNKYSYDGKVDFCDLIEASAQLSGIHIASTTQNKTGGYLSKVYDAVIMQHKLFSKDTKFTLKLTALEQMSNYFIYHSQIFCDNTLILEVKLGIILSNNLNMDDIKQNNVNIISKFAGDNTNIYSCLEKNEDSICVAFDKNASFFEGHFQNYPIVPGIYTIKTGCIILSQFYKPNTNINSVVKLCDCKFMDLILPEEKVIFKIKELKTNHFVIQVKSVNQNNIKAIFSLLY